MPPKPQATKSAPHFDNVNGWLQHLADNRRTLKQSTATKPGVWKVFKDKFQEAGSLSSATLYNQYLQHAGITITDEAMVLVISRDSPAWPTASLASESYSRAPTPTPTP